MEKEKPSEIIVKVLGLGNIESDEGLERGIDVILSIEGSILKVEETDNQDGTFNRMFKVKIITLACQPKK